MTQLVKICGLRTVEAAAKAIDLGADLLGVIMVPNRKRTADPEVVREISDLAITKRKSLGRRFQTMKEIITHLQQQKFTSFEDYLLSAKLLIQENGPFLVGVFRNQNVDDVFQAAKDCSLDFIQLHGSEEVNDYLAQNETIDYGIIKRFVLPTHVPDMAAFFPTLIESPSKGFAFPLLDSEMGGEGQTIDWTLINELQGKFILAGGLNPDNLADTIPYLKNVFGFDVSGGVEDENGDKDLEKIEMFVLNGKSLHGV